MDVRRYLKSSSDSMRMADGIHRASYVARNPIPDSQNAIHRADGATEHGFAGGLVPGIVLFAYVCESLRGSLGAEWLNHGLTRVSYRRPVYNGQLVTADLRLRATGADVALTSNAADRCVTAKAWFDGASYGGSRPALRGSAPLRASMDGTTLVKMEELGGVEVTFDATAITTEIASYGIDASWYLDANIVPLAYVALTWFELSEQAFVRPGPSILAGNEMVVIRPIRVGERVSVRARVDRLFSRNGNRYATFEIGWFSDDGPRVWALHTSIYELRTP